jgi:hypothetical protein
MRRWLIKGSGIVCYAMKLVQRFDDDAGVLLVTVMAMVMVMVMARTTAQIATKVPRNQL